MLGNDIDYKYYFREMETDLMRCHVIGLEFGMNPHEVYETWDKLQIAQTYSYLAHTKHSKRF